MKRYNVAILGATGAVGEQMIRVLWERRFPIGGLRLLSSERSAGGRMDTPFGNAELGLACETAFEGADIVLGAAENDIARRFAPAIRAAGAVFVDNSSAFRMDPDVPLVVPEINPDDALKHNGIISNPNCSTIIALTAVNAINKLSPIEYMVVSTYQAVSGAGAGGPMELEAQVAALQRGEAVGGCTPEQVLGAPRRGLKVVYATDTRPCAALEAAARDADLLCMDATYADDADLPLNTFLNLLETGELKVHLYKYCFLKRLE